MREIYVVHGVMTKKLSFANVYSTRDAAIASAVDGYDCKVTYDSDNDRFFITYDNGDIATIDKTIVK